MGGQGSPVWERIRAPLSLSQGLPQVGGGGGGVCHLTALGQGKATAQKEHDIPRHLLFNYFPVEEGRRGLQLPWFFYSPSRRGWVTKSQQAFLPFPSPLCTGLYQSLMHVREGPSVLQHHDFVPESLCPWQITPTSLGLVYSCRVWSKGRRMPEGGVCPEALPCPRPGAYLVPESALGSWRA